MIACEPAAGLSVFDANTRCVYVRWAPRLSVTLNVPVELTELLSPEARTTSSEFAGGVKLAVVAVNGLLEAPLTATAGDEASIARVTTLLRPQSAAVICPAARNCSTVVTFHGAAAICAAVTVLVASFRVDRLNTRVAVSGVPSAPSPTAIFVQRQFAARQTTALVIALVVLLNDNVTCTA
jgi:hypothetical protein